MNTQKLLEYYRLTQEEYHVIGNWLGHIPSRLELALFSALWSEHCSYKSSAIHLKKLFFKSPRVLSALGENAGVVDLGKGEKVAFKIESHNHPSQIVPYHGAATGVGGILRDVFVMNARPMALANYLCFGAPFADLTSELVDGVVQGIGGYGNSIGIPVLTGQTEFHPSYNKNVIVNALALGYFGPKDEVMSSRAKGPGNLLVYVGARTGRDGIHGASMASESFTENQGENKKTCVQVGDPFYGKLLMESCLEVMKKSLVVAAQDMGAAGLISSSFEMISKGGVGMRLYLDKVPLRDPSMKAEDILLSESQERVLLLVHPDKYSEVRNIFMKWGLPIAVIGELIKEVNVEILWENKSLVQMNPLYLTERAPRYCRFYRKWKARYHVKTKQKARASLPNNKDMSSVLLSILKDVRGCSREFIYRQYDQRVGSSTVKDCSFPVGVLRLPHSGRALGLCMGGRPHIMRTDSLEGGKDSVYEPALQLAAYGFTPLAMTDGLNFGSPEKERVMSSFVACVEGMATASRSLQVPVVSGNVSFYNQTKERSISATPATAMIGVKDSLKIPPSAISKEAVSCGVYLVSAHQIFCKGLIGDVFKEAPFFYGCLNASSVCRFISQVQKACVTAAPDSIRLVGKLGLAYTLARMVMNSSMGIEIKTNYDPFQERLYEIILVLKESKVSVWKRFFSSDSHSMNLSFQMEKLGSIVEKPVFSFNDMELSMSQLQESYNSGWNRVFKNTPAEQKAYRNGVESCSPFSQVR
ncbi:MAG: phosphoribosylformylglycinamidine synthase subunit PurL [Bdellovibrionales bacterium]|nr:phosphoribosylformylglycinamidine synthase subunit PurL [Bdellovibrionales bacterium]